ncbi:TerB family tellurite resistance protein [Haloferula sp.]|uniref:TerB family tellurite resistance protein n=1 Tax=Haloferula sp. TaxID=2497595 RepID=UPI003C77AF67
MTEKESYSANGEALYSICLLAAFADGEKGTVEREELKKIGEALLPEELHPAAVYQKVLLGKTDAAAEAAKLETKEWKQLAYEMAVKVCEADGVTEPSEKAFLKELAEQLGIPAKEAGAIVADADEMGAASLEEVDTALLPPPLPAGPAVKDEVDSLIMRYSIINGALELLPETLSTMAIIPLQMKLVNSVGKHHGVSMDRQQLVEFLGAAGIGATSQVVEGMARKMIGGLTGKLGKKFLGKSFGGLAKKGVDQLTSSAFSFASTWAIGQLAQRYYANGRTWSGINARETYQALRQRAEPLHQKFLPEIQREASVLDYKKVLSMVRG